MPAYQTAPYQQRKSLLPGVIGYSFGTFKYISNPTARLSIQSVSITTNVATLGVTLLEGNIPTVGQLISVQGTQTATSGGAPNFNVTNATITAVSINASTGVGTISYALTSTNIASTPDSGMAYVPPTVTQEALPGTAAAGQQFAISPGNLASNNQRGLSWFTQFTGSPSTVTMLLQIANVDQDSEYQTIDESTNTAGETRSVANITAGFVRVKAASTGGTSPTVAAGISIT